ncbi:hypothetical protein H8R18_06315 [Nanchangia anserum]|uniref:Uncharacterized protein n=1 Tax=Nanchangia anserum TaxID=2692125 RepID=A0A8I0GBB9_9ACTO|nr:hypothetical protein [Nanchangia anserum]MBD3689146.1 hypothetical protein [Nanchangia anserum]QOX81379.1 hypothetical protein H8R18_06315 [Nanchangia anserum]
MKFEAVSADTSEKLITHTRDLFDTSRVKVFTTPPSLAFDRAVAYALPTPEGTHYGVTIPITGAVRISNFTVIFSPDGQVSNYAETHTKKTDDGFINIAQWINGGKSLEKTAYVGDLDFDAPGGNSTPSFPLDRSWQKAVACLAAVLGVSSGVAAVVLSLCGGSCAVPEPTFSKAVCAACVGGIVTLGGASITGVVKCFGYW